MTEPVGSTQNLSSGDAGRSPEVDDTTMGVRPADALHIPPGTDAVEHFYDNGFTDGMPVVIPTRGRVAQMPLGTGGASCLGAASELREERLVRVSVSVTV